MRAKIILFLDNGLSPIEISESLDVSIKTVYKWWNRFIEEGTTGLLDQPRPGRPTVINEKIVKKVLKLTTERVPHETTHWSVTLMAKYAQVTTWQVRKIWKTADIKPHRTKTFKFSNDAQF